MTALRVSKERQQRFLQALAEADDVAAATTFAGVKRAKVYQLRKTDPAFAAQWDRAKEAAVGRLEQEARRRALEGLQEPLLSDGKIVRDDDGRPVAVRRYSDDLLLALLKAHRPEMFGDHRLTGEAIYPRWLRCLAFVFVGAVAWAVGMLTLHSFAGRL